MADPASAAPPAIAREGVWQVFGKNARQRLAVALERSGGDPGAAARMLRDEGLIPAVRNTSFEAHEGETFVIMGLSGSGKSTLIRCISHLIQGTAGAIRIEGEDILTASKSRLIELRRRNPGMVFQHFGLFPHMTVAENVAFPLKMQGQGAKARQARALHVALPAGAGAQCRGRGGGDGEPQRPGRRPAGRRIMTPDPMTALRGRLGESGMVALLAVLVGAACLALQPCCSGSASGPTPRPGR